MLINIRRGVIVKNTQIQKADIYAKILIFSCSAGYKNLKFVANYVILRRLNKLIPLFILEKQ